MTDRRSSVSEFDHIEGIGRGPIGRHELLELARRRGYPKFVDERGTEIEGQHAWQESPFTYAIDRRQAYEFLRGRS